MQMRKALALSSQLGKLLSRHASKPAPPDENQVPGRAGPMDARQSAADRTAVLTDSADVGAGTQETRLRGDPGAKVSEHWRIPPLHQRTTKLSAQCLVQILHIVAEDGALHRQEVSESAAIHDCVTHLLSKASEACTALCMQRG